jgi:tetratricopeptide (TPR) repeat protein
MSFVTQASIPEVLEHPESGASLLADRTAILAQINDLGPPDLVNLTKIIGTPTKNSTTQSLQTTPTYFYYTGADTSNVATVAALLNSIANIIDQEPQIWFGKTKHFHVSHASYSSYNAFRKLDVRVHVSFPGSVDWEVLDAYGNRATSAIVSTEEADEIWEETYLSSIVRSLVTSDDDGDFASIVEIRRINPFLEPKFSVPQFLTGFKHLYSQGDKLGCNEDSQTPTLLNNYLVDAFFKCLDLTNCYDQALEVLQELQKKHPEVAALIAKLLFAANKEIDAVKFIHETLSSATNLCEVPAAYYLLLLQSEYCLEKSRADLALPLAIKSVEAAPSLFATWSHLVKVYITQNKFEDALLTLNACPMVTHKDKYILKRIEIGAARKASQNADDQALPYISGSSPPASDMHLPLPQDVFLRGVTDLSSMEVAAEHNQLAKSNLNEIGKNSVDSSNILTPQKLLNLPASNLKSTFRRAYGLLADIVHKIGWEGMLNTRSKVFVMEEEWRTNPAKSESSAEIAKPQTLTTEANNGIGVDDVKEIRRKRLCERWLDNLFMLLYEDMKAYTFCRTQEMQAESMMDSTEAPVSKQTLSESLGLWGGARSRSNSTVNHDSNNGSNGLKTPKVDAYTESRSCLEWELLGLVSERLGHVRDAQRCYERALARRFSVRAARKLIGIYSRWRERARKQIGIQGKLQYEDLSKSTKNALLGQSKWNHSTFSVGGKLESPPSLETHHANASSISVSAHSNKASAHVRDPTRYDPALLRICVGLLVWDYRWYTVFSPLLLNTLADVVNDMGVTKTESEVRVWFDDVHGNRGVLDLISVYIQMLTSWKRIEADD